MKNYIKLLKIFATLLIIAVLGFFVVGKINDNKPNENTVQVQTNEISIDASKYAGRSALEATMAEVREIKTEGSGINAYVTALNGRAADTAKNEFWELIINGKPSEVGAGSYIIKDGDNITWKINTF